MKKLTLLSSLKFVSIFLGVFLFVGSLTLGGVAYAHKGKYYPGITVAGVHVGGMIRSEGDKAIADRLKTYSEHKVVVTVPKVAEGVNEKTGDYPDVEVTTTTKELGLIFTDTTSQVTAWELGHSRNPLIWVKTAIPAFFKTTEYSLPYSIDHEQVAAFINTQVAPQITVPIPAKISIVASKITIDSAVPGITIDQDKLANDLAKSLESVADLDTTYLRAPYAVVDSTVTAATVQPVAEQLDKLGNLKVAMTTDGVNLVPKRDDLLNWFTVTQTDAGGISLALNQDAVSTYLAKNAKNKLKTAESLKAATTALSTYLKDDQSKLDYTKALAVALVAKPAEVIDTPAGVPTDLFPEKYVYVSLKTQRLSLVSNNAVEKTYVVSTGKWSTPTPLGTFHIHGKIPRAYSRSFGLYMPWWQNFLNNEYGLHELPEWPSGYKEGEAHLGRPVSHGCIRLGIGSAKEVYDWTVDGTPVVIVAS